MSPSYAALANEITTDPTNAGYAGMSDAQVLASLNAPITVQQAVPMAAALIWAAQNGVMAKLQAHVAAGASDALYSAAEAVLYGFQGGFPNLDVTNSAIQTMLAAFESAGDFTSAQAAALLALGQTATTRAQQIVGWGVPVQLPDIVKVRGS